MKWLDKLKLGQRKTREIELEETLREARDLIAEAAEHGDFADTWNERTFQFYKRSGKLLEIS